MAKCEEPDSRVERGVAAGRQPREVARGVFRERAPGLTSVRVMEPFSRAGGRERGACESLSTVTSVTSDGLPLTSAFLMGLFRPLSPAPGESDSQPVLPAQRPRVSGGSARGQGAGCPG